MSLKLEARVSYGAWVGVCAELTEFLFREGFVNGVKSPYEGSPFLNRHLALEVTQWTSDMSCMWRDVVPGNFTQGRIQCCSGPHPQAVALSRGSGLLLRIAASGTAPRAMVHGRG